MPRRHVKSSDNGKAGGEMSTEPSLGAGGPSGGYVSRKPESHKEMQERLLNSIYHMFTDPAKLGDRFNNAGFEAMGKDLGLKVLHPRKKITVMIIGNHSAGKSSFVNWYVEQEVQKTGVAIETQGFTVITNGNRSVDLKGEGAMMMIPHIKVVLDRFSDADARGFKDNLSISVTTSSAKHMKLLDLVDTPGLVDGNVAYPFDVNRVIAEMADIVDLILVFLDPQGQALCSRTMEVVEDLNNRGHHEKMHYYLTKVDTIKKQQDLHKVISQITQGLTTRVPASHGFELPTMYIPQEGEKVPDEIAALNELGRLCNDVEKTIERKVQDNMTVLTKTMDTIQGTLESTLAAESAKRAQISRWTLYRLAMSPLFPLLVILSFLDLCVSYEDYLPQKLVDMSLMKWLLGSRKMLQTINYVPDVFGIDEPLERLLLWIVVFFVVSVFYQFFVCRTRRLRARSKDDIKRFESYHQSVLDMRQYAEDMYREFVVAAQTPEYQTR